VVVVATLDDFDVGRENFRFLVDVCLLGADLGAEVDVVDVAWLVENREETFAFDGVVLVADACCDKQSQYWPAWIILDPTLPAFFNSSDGGAGPPNTQKNTHWSLTPTNLTLFHIPPIARTRAHVAYRNRDQVGELTKEFKVSVD
jgi:hypothetical protein